MVWSVDELSLTNYLPGHRLLLRIPDLEFVLLNPGIRHHCVYVRENSLIFSEILVGNFISTMQSDLKSSFVNT